MNFIVKVYTKVSGARDEQSEALRATDMRDAEDIVSRLEGGNRRCVVCVRILTQVGTLTIPVARLEDVYEDIGRVIDEQATRNVTKMAR